MHVTHLIHSLGPGGAEALLVELAQVAEQGGFSISVVGMVSHPEPVHAVALRDLGIPVRTLDLGTRWDLRALSRAVAGCRELGPDVVHTHLKHADLVGALVSRRLDVPQVSTLHVIEDVTTPQAAAKRWLAAKVRDRVAARTIAVSDAQREWYVDHFGVDPEHVQRLYNGVLPVPPLTADERRSVRASWHVPEEAVVAGNIALMRQGKGHDDLLDAVVMLPDDSPLHLLLVGDGSERHRLEQRVAADPALRRRVTFLGYRDDVPRLLPALDLVVHPTLADALPTALIQAASAGLPVIASDVGGVPEIVGTSGVLLPPRSAAALAEAMGQLAADPRRRARAGTRAKEHFAAEFDASMWARSLGELYREVTLRRRSPNRPGGG